MKKRTGLLCLALTLLSVKISFAELETVHIGNLDLEGGQYFLGDSPSSFGGNARLYYSPAVSFRNSNILSPLFSLEYRGTRDVQDLVGGGTLTRQAMDTGVLLRNIRTIKDGRLIGRLGYRRSFINETKDEDWGEVYLTTTGFLQAPK